MPAAFNPDSETAEQEVAEVAENKGVEESRLGWCLPAPCKAHGFDSPLSPFPSVQIPRSVFPVPRLFDLCPSEFICGSIGVFETDL